MFSCWLVQSCCKFPYLSCRSASSVCRSVIAKGHSCLINFVSSQIWGSHIGDYKVCLLLGDDMFSWILYKSLQEQNQHSCQASSQSCPESTWYQNIIWNIQKWISKYANYWLGMTLCSWHAVLWFERRPCFRA
jgi:hypothetical protein